MHSTAILYYSRSPSSLTQVTFTPHQRNGDRGEKRGRNKRGWSRHESCITASVAVTEQQQQEKNKTKEDQSSEATITTKSNLNKLKRKKKFSISGLILLLVLVGPTLAETQFKATVKVQVHSRRRAAVFHGSATMRRPGKEQSRLVFDP